MIGYSSSRDSVGIDVIVTISTQAYPYLNVFLYIWFSLKNVLVETRRVIFD